MVNPISIKIRTLTADQGIRSDVEDIQREDLWITIGGVTAATTNPGLLAGPPVPQKQLFDIEPFDEPKSSVSSSMIGV
jgi:hypothetical protein